MLGQGATERPRELPERLREAPREAPGAPGGYPRFRERAQRGRHQKAPDRPGEARSGPRETHIEAGEAPEGPHIGPREAQGSPSRRGGAKGGVGFWAG